MPAPKRGKIEFQHIALMDLQAFQWETRAQSSHDIAVDFDHVQTGDVVEQRRSECAWTRADLDDAVLAPGINGGDDLPDDAAILQKVLAEPLSGGIRCLQGARPDLARGPSIAFSALRGAVQRRRGRAAAVPHS